MKIPFAKSAIALVIGGLPIAANALVLEDYLIANSSYEDAFLDAAFSAGDGPRNEQVSYDLFLNARYTKTFNTLPRSWTLTLTGFAQADRQGTTPTARLNDENGDAILDPNGLEQFIDLADDSSDFGASIEGTIDNYFSDSAYPKAFWFGQGRAEHIDSAIDDSFGATVGLGYGRVYNATPLAQVIRIVEELNEEGLLSGPIPDSVALETAEIIDREDEFKSKFGADEYKRDYYAAIEEALSRSGAIVGGRLGALGALTIDEILEEEPISTRRHGWVVRAGAGFQASQLSGLADNDPKLLLQWEYAKPRGYKGQFINLLSYEPVFGDETTQVIRNVMSYTHELSDRVDWVNSWMLTYSDGDDELGQNVTSTTNMLTSSYQYHLNNRLDYTATLTLNQSDNDPNPPNDPEDATQPFPGDDPTINFVMGLQYRLK